MDQKTFLVFVSEKLIKKLIIFGQPLTRYLEIHSLKAHELKTPSLRTREHFTSLQRNRLFNLKHHSKRTTNLLGFV